MRLFQVLNLLRLPDAVPDDPRAMWQQLGSGEAVGRAYLKYLRDALMEPYSIG